MLRLAALSVGFDDASFPLPEFSDGLYFAVACTDYVQLLGGTAAPATRAKQYRTALRREPAGTFAPFSVAQWTQLDQYTEAYSACLNWPTPTHLFAPITKRPPLVPPRLHVLILSGTADSLTPWPDGATVVASQFGKSARVVQGREPYPCDTANGPRRRLSCAKFFKTFLNNPSCPGPSEHLRAPGESRRFTLLAVIRCGSAQVAGAKPRRRRGIRWGGRRCRPRVDRTGHGRG